MSNVKQELGDVKVMVLNKGYCPYCSEGKGEDGKVELKWGEALPIQLLYRFNRELDDLGSGYFEIIRGRDPPKPLKFPLLGYLKNIKHCELERARMCAEAETCIEAEYQAVFWTSLGVNCLPAVTSVEIDLEI